MNTSTKTVSLSHNPCPSYHNAPPPPQPSPTLPQPSPSHNWNPFLDLLTTCFPFCLPSSQPLLILASLVTTQSMLLAVYWFNNLLLSPEATVLVHGATGTDTTLQVTSLAQLLLDPDCRTIRGWESTSQWSSEWYHLCRVTIVFAFFYRFEALIEREWIQAGHPFSDRCSKCAYARSNSKTESPVFLLFLDCVWQV